MKKEQHVYKIHDGDKGQVYVFNITRHKDKITIDSIWMVVIHNGLETRIILNIPGIMDQILVEPHENTDQSTKALLDSWFGDMELAAEDLIEVDMDEYEIDTVDLLEAADKAAILHDSKYNDLINELLNGKSK